MKEQWKSIKGYAGLYEVSDLGRVRSLKYGKAKVLTPGVRLDGYLMVGLRKNGKRKYFFVHRLVYEAFCGAIPKGLTVDHINADKTDNRLENLQLLTRGDNSRKSNNKQLELIAAEHPYTKLSFASSVKAGEFFGFKKKGQIGDFISRARQRGRDWINIKGEKYFFSQAQ